jgi:CRP/FNR family transcriptional regulator, anaerobic regulatory protein
MVTKRVTLSQAWEGNADCLNCSLRSTALFGGLTKQDFEQMHDPVEQVDLKPGEALYKIGASGHHLFTVRSGLLKLVQYLPDGTQRIVRLMGSTDVLGLEVLLDKPYEHEAIVLRASEICRYPRQTVEHFSQTNPVFYKDLLGRWQKDLATADDWLTRLATGPAKKRMANLLLRLAEDDTNECFLFSREDIGSILSITVETASRILSEFKRLNLVTEVRSNHLQLDIEGLTELIES